MGDVEHLYHYKISKDKKDIVSDWSHCDNNIRIPITILKIILNIIKNNSGNINQEQILSKTANQIDKINNDEKIIFYAYRTIYDGLTLLSESKMIRRYLKSRFWEFLSDDIENDLLNKIRSK